MLKKNTFIYITCILLSSCFADLEENPKGLLTPQRYFNKLDDFEQAIVGAYSPLFTNWQGFDHIYPFIMASGAEDILGNYGFNTIIEFEEHNISPENPYIASLWAVLYKSIANCNLVLESANDIDKIPEEQVKPIVGQAYFLRALNYFYLTRWFGEIQVITEFNSTESFKVQQSPIEAIYEQIVSDLEAAEALLPLHFDEKGKATQGAAKALLSKVYLTMAGWPLNQTSNYEKAREKALEVMQMGYGLETEFADLWKYENKLTNKEFIFAFHGISTQGDTYGSHIHPSIKAGGHDTGVAWSDFYSHLEFYQAFPEGNRKKAAFATVFDDGTHFKDARIAYPHIGKYRDVGPNYQTKNGDGFFPLLRYADVLLIYAEAANKTGQQQNAIEKLNQIRRRAAGVPIQDPNPTYDALQNLTEVDLDELILKERKWELAFEIDRWFDIVRRQQLQKIYPNAPERAYWLPKPANQINLPSNQQYNGLRQNPGY
jgi:starch-binding outer membrane protein, SusD/RagB family